MLSRSTVVVVGAGASKELNLPLGDDLRDDIAGLLNITFPDGFEQQTGDSQICNILRSLARESDGQGINRLLNKCWLIRDALPASISIDNLLDAHRSDLEIATLGKLAIAKAILAAERQSKLFVRRSNGDAFELRNLSDTWLIPMFQILTEGVPREDAASIFENVTFLIFNYDRCLEYFLPKALEKYYGFSTNDASEIAENAKIIHPYGRVGELGRAPSLATAAFGAESFDLQKIAAGIRTFSEGLKFESHRDEIRQSVAEAEQIVFLGFAFHPLNMEILSLENPSHILKVFGTTLGLAEAAVRSVEYDIYDTIQKRPPSSTVGGMELEVAEMNLESRTASEFLYAHFRGIS